MENRMYRRRDRGKGNKKLCCRKEAARCFVKERIGGELGEAYTFFGFVSV